jgi:hypothetical protein
MLYTGRQLQARLFSCRTGIVTPISVPERTVSCSGYPAIRNAGRLLEQVMALGAGVISMILRKEDETLCFAPVI